MATYQMRPDRFTLAQYQRLVGHVGKVTSYIGGRYTYEMERNADVDQLNVELTFKMKLPNFFPEALPLPDED